MWICLATVNLSMSLYSMYRISKALKADSESLLFLEYKHLYNALINWNFHICTEVKIEPKALFYLVYVKKCRVERVYLTVAFYSDFRGKE